VLKDKILVKASSLLHVLGIYVTRILKSAEWKRKSLHTLWPQPKFIREDNGGCYVRGTVIIWSYGPDKITWTTSIPNAVFVLYTHVHKIRGSLKCGTFTISIIFPLKNKVNYYTRDNVLKTTWAFRWYQKTLGFTPLRGLIEGNNGGLTNPKSKGGGQTG
jgi:hypothetical protein